MALRLVLMEKRVSKSGSYFINSTSRKFRTIRILNDLSTEIIFESKPPPSVWTFRMRTWWKKEPISTEEKSSNAETNQLNSVIWSFGQSGFSYRDQGRLFQNEHCPKSAMNSIEVFTEKIKPAVMVDFGVEYRDQSTMKKVSRIRGPPTLWCKDQQKGVVNRNFRCTLSDYDYGETYGTCLRGRIRLRKSRRYKSSNIQWSF